MNNNYTFCNNCGKNGHQFHKCKNAITSVGIIVFRPSINGLQYLLICRKTTLGFVDFIRGKYPIMDPDYIIGILNETTEYEKSLIRNKSFKELWNYFLVVKILLNIFLCSTLFGQFNQLYNGFGLDIYLSCCL